MLVAAAGCIKDRIAPAVSTGSAAQELIHYWNFNDSLNLTAPASTIGGGSIAVDSAVYDRVDGGALLNTRNSDDSGAALRVRNPCKSMTWKLPTAGYGCPVVSFAVMRTGSGAQRNLITYTTDGVAFRSDGLSLTAINITESWALVALDFSAVPASADNAAFAVKITFAEGNTNASGNDRYDNLACMAEPIPAAPPPSADSLLHLWSFNAATADLALLTQPDRTTGGGTLAYTAVWDTSAAGTELNAYAAAAAGAGQAIKLKNPAGSFMISAPTAGFKNILLKYAARRNASGPQTQTISYSLDGGATFTSAGLSDYVIGVGTDYQLVSLDFSGIAGAADNPAFRIRIAFSVGNGNPAGYTLLDNVAIEGDPK